MLSEEIQLIYINYLIAYTVVCVYDVTDNAFHDVIHISKVPLAVAVVEDFDSFAVHQLIGKAKICHIRTTSRAIDREEPQTSRGDIVEFGVSMCHQLVGLLGSRIQRNRIVHLVIGGAFGVCIFQLCLRQQQEGALLHR